MKKGSKAAIVCCSNGQRQDFREKLEKLKDTLRQIGICPVCSQYIFERESVFSGTAKERAEALMDFYRDKEIAAIFDISGGDIANELLPYLDFSVIRDSDKLFWGYSDLTVMINAIYAKTGKPSVLYQVRNLIYDHGETQTNDFTASVLDGKEDLFSFSLQWVQGQRLQGIVVGGNIRCLLKLAGTPYWPDMRKKVLLLEAFGGTAAQMTAYLNQLQQMGVFEQISGILLGTFTKMEQDLCKPGIEELVKRYAGPDLPVAKTGEIGHGTDSKAIMIGKEIDTDDTCRPKTSSKSRAG